MRGGDWKQRHSAARLIIAIRAEKRASKPAPVVHPQLNAVLPTPEQHSAADLDRLAQQDLN